MDWDCNGLLALIAIIPIFILVGRQKVKKDGYLWKRKFKGIATKSIRKRMRKSDIFIAACALVYLTINVLFSLKLLSLSSGEEQKNVESFVLLSSAWAFWFPVLGLQIPMLSFFEVRLTTTKRLFLGVWFLIPLGMSIFAALITGEIQLIREGLISSSILLLFCGPAIIVGKDFLRFYSGLCGKIVMLGLDRDKYRLYGEADE
ncbi:hypothetical protein STSP2_03095 [Anaerohalosphaera lusitana]|uniref:Uncharacterized protein n=1 Tax=Anaerohalosphaera lusitana TaxID=1936003 RepID=A0A1U9NPZ4_9BACT|nr:hypothetical protein [Anaerohalosphaera lusitana]AQT69895.1 hypothetical protein STSP2_03095 [Anaerohalosphaera lusitana]